MHAYYIISMTTTGFFFIINYYRGLAPFHRDIRSSIEK
jgi:hypothetical protein